MKDESYRRRVQDALKVRCIHLKTKRAYLGLPNADDDRVVGSQPAQGVGYGLGAS